MSELTITKSQIQGDVSATVFHLQGHLHGTTEQVLLDHAHQAYEEGTRYLLLDMSDLEVLSSAGLRAIQNIFKLFTPEDDVDIMRQHGDEPYKSPYLKMVCSKPEIYYILNITGFLQNILIYNNLSDGADSF